MRTLSADLRHKPLCAWSPLSRLNIFTALLLTMGALSLRGNERGPLDLAARGGEWSEEVVRGLESDAESFVVEVQIDPVAAEGGDLQVVAGLVVGLEKAAVPASEPTAGLRMDLREGSGMARFDLSHRGNPLAVREPRPKPPGWWGPVAGYLCPNELPLRDGTGYRIKLVVWPEGEASRVRLFVDFDDRPAEEHRLTGRLRAGTLKLFAMRGGAAPGVTQTSRFTVLRAERLDPRGAAELPPIWESVLRALDFSHPAMQPVGTAIRERRMDEAKALFLHHMRRRREPTGPSMKEVDSTVLHADWQKIADEALAGRYGTAGYFTQFASEWKDTNGETHPWVLQKDPLQVNWVRDNGHLNRHFHWVSLAKAWEESPQPKYAQRFSAEVFDWVSREPFFWERCPAIGGVNVMDGTSFRWGFMNTSNIGRRLELTWWPAYEVFRKSPDFSDDAHFAMLLGMLRQARLIMNPSSFAVHDDSAAHTTMALLQTALLLPEFAESAEWKATAEKRWDEVLARQFHPDGSHVSLSTGYNWASITALENYLRLFNRFGGSPPEKYLRILENAVEHTMLLTAPNQGNIDLNDGGWGLFDDRFRETLKWLPHREDFQWMATKGAEGSPPKQAALYFPNAGQYVMRTGWGPEEKYLFFGAGPWGASHGKFDALNIYAQFGSHLLIRNAGHGSYSGVGNTKHAGQSLSFNTLSPDWAQENSIPQWKQDMHRGFGPPKRRWVNDEHFSYGEGTFEYGWYHKEEHIKGKWLRQVIFVKGKQPKRDGYYVVIDTVEPADNKLRTWRHPWQLGLNAGNIAIRESDRSTTAITPGAALQILPVGEMKPRVIQGQEKPELLGWRIYDTTANPWPVPTYEWQAKDTFSRAWVIQMQANESEWPVRSVETNPTEHPGELRFTVHRRNGGSDQVIRRFPGGSSPDVTVIRQDASGTTTAELTMDGGEDSVAKPSLPANAKSP